MPTYSISMANLERVALHRLLFSWLLCAATRVHPSSSILPPLHAASLPRLIFLHSSVLLLLLCLPIER